MPALAWIALIILGGGIGLNQAGKGIDAAGEGVRDLAIAGAVLGGAFIVAKQAKVI